MPLFAKLSIIIADVFLSDGDQGLGLNGIETSQYALYELPIQFHILRMVHEFMNVIRDNFCTLDFNL